MIRVNAACVVAHMAKDKPFRVPVLDHVGEAVSELWHTVNVDAAIPVGVFGARPKPATRAFLCVFLKALRDGKSVVLNLTHGFWVTILTFCLIVS